MKPAKIAVITLFLFMAISGIGGVMLAGYSFIVRGGVGCLAGSAVQTPGRRYSPPAPPAAPPASHKRY